MSGNNTLNDEELRFSQISDDDFSEEDQTLFNSYLYSKEAQAVEQAHEAKLAAKENQLFVIDGADIQLGPHIGTFSVKNDTPTIQDKLVGTIIEKTPMNFTLIDKFEVLSVIGDWQNTATVSFQNRKALIKGSSIQITGKMQGNNPLENHELKFITSGQINIPTSIDTTGTPLPPYKTKPKIVKGYWSKDKHGVNQIKEAYLEDTVYFVIETFGIEDGKKLTVQLYDYDHFLWHDLWNPDDKIDSPRVVLVKNNLAVIEVYLKPHWKEHIDAEKGLPFANSAIELYWKISCANKKISEKIFPQETDYHLKVRNNRDIYIKPACPSAEYYFPEIYSQRGELMIFVDALQDWVNGYAGEKISERVKKWITDQSEMIVLAKIEKGQLGTNFGDVIQGARHRRTTVTEQLADGRNVSYQQAPNKGAFVKGKTTKGISQYSFFEQTSHRVKSLYLLRDCAKIFDKFYDITDFAKGGNIGDAMEGVIMTALRSSNPLLGAMINVTLGLSNQYFQEWVEEGVVESEKMLEEDKLEGFNTLRTKLYRYTFLKDIYKIDYISYEAMQGLLEGKIKNWEQLNSYGNHNEEVAILYKISKNGYITIIDSFYINTKN
ncbi:MAG: hypothetical protein Q4C98_11380 [Capnocytophaga sp.]|nr:hypothetical protein [Capnocytophaga sp.]